MVCDAGRSSARQSPVPPKQEADLVCAGVTQRQRERKNPAGATPQESFAHARHVGTTAIARASLPVTDGIALAHISPFHYRHRLHCSCVAEQDATEYDAEASRQRQVDRNRSHSATPLDRVDAENPEGGRHHLITRSTLL